MKKAILSPLCSAFVIPGLGQILNKELKKGGCILAGVFILFVVGTIKLFLIIKAMSETSQSNPLDQGAVMEHLHSADLSMLRYTILAFALLWLYSVVDAFWKGRKLDRLEAGGLS
jgi:hypothetical protein